LYSDNKGWDFKNVVKNVVKNGGGVLLLSVDNIDKRVGIV
jgi:hypothetical protein